MPSFQRYTTLSKKGVCLLLSLSPSLSRIPKPPSFLRSTRTVVLLSTPDFTQSIDNVPIDLATDDDEEEDKRNVQR